MSAIALPLFNSTTANNGTPVNVEKVQSISLVTSEPVVSGQSGTYEIIFKFDMGTPAVVWSYDTKVLRDASYAALIAAVSTPIV